MSGVEKGNSDVMELFSKGKLVKIGAPMVRYSKLQFRTLLREYNCDLCFTPMILADSFRCSEKARRNEFTTSLGDNPVIVQFAANTADDFVEAARMVSPYCSGVDLNCGCPQRWAKQQGLGCSLLNDPERVSDIVKTCRNQIPKPFTISVKIRLLKELRKTVELCRALEKAGAGFLSVHARTVDRNSGDIDTEAVRTVVGSVACPVVANGGIKSLGDCARLRDETGCHGVMAANALLANPTLFSGSNLTTTDCVQNWLDICFNSTLADRNARAQISIPERPPNLTFQCFHHHLVFMLEKVLPKDKRRTFNNLQTFADDLSFLHENLGIKPRLFDSHRFGRNSFLDLRYAAGKDLDGKGYDYEESDGKFFQSQVSLLDDFSVSYSLEELFL